MPHKQNSTDQRPIKVQHLPVCTLNLCLLECVWTVIIHSSKGNGLYTLIKPNKKKSTYVSSQLHTLHFYYQIWHIAVFSILFHIVCLVSQNTNFNVYMSFQSPLFLCVSCMDQRPCTNALICHFDSCAILKPKFCLTLQQIGFTELQRI